MTIKKINWNRNLSNPFYGLMNHVSRASGSKVVKISAIYQTADGRFGAFAYGASWKDWKAANDFATDLKEMFEKEIELENKRTKKRSPNKARRLKPVITS